MDENNSNSTSSSEEDVPADNPITNLENWIIGLTIAVEGLERHFPDQKDSESKDGNAVEPKEYSSSNSNLKLTQTITNISQLLQNFSDAVIQKVIELELEREEAEMDQEALKAEDDHSYNSTSSRFMDVPER